MTHPQHGDRNGPYIFDATLNRWVSAAPDPVPARKKSRWWSWLIAAFLGVLGVWLLVPPDEQPHGSTDKERVVALCSKLVREQSLTPSTLKFYTAEAVERPDDWEVTVEVDEQNLFGAMLRVSYTCQVTYDDETGLFSALRVE
ncbi:hypothetical protein [Rhodococcus sp. SJ-3]|uniref:hypothetical protein n=1 Tax=Rhodococcus sp. SJ-3 TaxID=3454628 RepID=UPI003F7A3BCF